MVNPLTASGLFLACSLVVANTASGGQTGPTPAAGPAPAGSGPAVPAPSDRPPDPLPPEVISRDNAGRATVRAVRLTAPLRLDGRLDEPVYENVLSMSDFIQIEPQPGAPATQKTDVWLFFDDENVYVTVRCWDDHPERIVANEMRRDSNTIFVGDDHVQVMLDTFYDRRNGFIFAVSPAGGRNDGQFINERQYNGDFNPVWTLKVGRFDRGWTFESAIPFKSLRYRPGQTQVWGFNIDRRTSWKNEDAFLTRVPSSYGPSVIMQASQAATVVGLEVPPASRNLEIKPYVISDLTTDLQAVPRIANDIGANAGLDVKYGLAQSMTADFTYNTDFAQVEADEQQVNLTRFNLFFPEKREFFLENQGTFAFGGAAVTGTTAGDTPILFYSRRIGLEQGRAIPIQTGGRVTGRLGRVSLGALNIQASDEAVTHSPSTNFSVLRMKRDLLRKSSIGAILTNRSVGQNGVGPNAAYGIDGAFRFFDSLTINTYWARTRNEGATGDDVSYRGQVDYPADRYGLQLERLVVGRRFNPDVGFVRRLDMRRSYGQFRFSPRLRRSKVVRKLSWIGTGTYIENGAGRVESRIGDGEFAVEFKNGDRLSAGYNTTYEFIPQPFPIARGVTLPVGGYDFASVRTGLTLGQQRRISGVWSLEYGSFYDGDKLTLGVSQGRVNFPPHVSIQPTYSLNLVDLAAGSFTTHLVGSRATYTVTPLMFLSALLQYNSGTHSIATNVRLRWEYQPGSELFIVYNEQRDTLIPAPDALSNRAIIVKVNRLFRF